MAEIPSEARTVSSHLVDGLDLGAVRLFLAAAELGSVAKAATRLGITQPSATVKLRKLERLLGLPLLDRSATGSVLTTGGDAVRESASSLLAAATGVLRDAESGREGEQRLRVAATRAIVDHRLGGYLLAAGFDDVVVDVTDLATRQVAQDVRAGRASVGFVDGPHAPLGLRSVVIDRFRLVAVTRPGHPVTADRSPTPSTVAAAPLIVRRVGSGTRDVVEGAFAAHGGAARPVEVATNAAALATARTGRGVAFVPSEQAGPDVGAGRLVEIDIDGIELEQPIRMCWSGSRPARHLAARLVDALTAPQP